ncbi:hypothetical protein [Bradyrhizobium sp. Leo121]|uniref:hypothetical protein n=1 Tax=Bradyrhizobium sp. Leo121 TaxID=1571195 RepID=UPI001A92D820|nr:hypothetical protein [Bradyrhizobium sp. Leo121]
MAAHIHRGDLPRAGPELLDERDDGERLCFLTLQLNPAFLPPGTVRSIDTLRNETFEPHFTAVAEYLVAVGLNMLDKNERLGRLAQQLLQKPFAMGIGCVPQVVPVQIQQIKRMITNPCSSAAQALGAVVGNREALVSAGPVCCPVRSLIKKRPAGMTGRGRFAIESLLDQCM